MPPGLSKASENGADFTGEMLLNKGRSQRLVGAFFFLMKVSKLKVHP